MACDPSQLVADAKCIECGVPSGMLMSVMISLLCQIRDNGGAVSSGVGAPTATPTTATAIYFDTGTGSQYNYYNGGWHLAA